MDSDEFAEELTSPEFDDSEFANRHINSIKEINTHNWKLNNSKSRDLSFSTFFLLLGFIISIIFIAISIHF